MVDDPAIRESDDLDAMVSKNSIAFAIVIGVIHMRFPVEFYRERRSMTVKVNNKSGDNLLTTEMKISCGVSAKCLPEILLGRSHQTAQLFGAFDFAGVNALSANDIAQQNLSPNPSPARRGELELADMSYVKMQN